MVRMAGGRASSWVGRGRKAGSAYGGAVRSLHLPGDRDLLPQVLGEQGGPSPYLRSALRSVPAYAAPVASVLRSQYFGRNRLALRQRHPARAELRGIGDDQHLDGWDLAGPGHLDPVRA